MIKEKGYIFFATNDWWNFYDVKPDYSIICSHVDSINNKYRILNEKKIPVFYSDVQDLTKREIIDKLIKID